eukprot:gene15486-23655_t
MEFEHRPLNGGQIAFFLAYVPTVLLWLYSEYLKQTRCEKKSDSQASEMEKLDRKLSAPDMTGDKGEKMKADGKVDVEQQSSSAEQPQQQQGQNGAPTTEHLPLLSLDNPPFRIAVLHTETIKGASGTLRAMTEFGAHLIFFYLCDRTTLFFDPTVKNYSRDTFWFIYLVLIAYNFATSLHYKQNGAYLNRDQTEEWKGWMQILFLMYHYFEAVEQYNAIRLYIAAYVWMTGFGNFSFYYVRKDFSPPRFFQMLWRLNFLVFWVCVVLGNSYMLYYICPMHTIWTFGVYFLLLAGNKYNTNQLVIIFKFALAIGLVAVLWSSKDLFYTMWQPFGSVVEYVNPAKDPTSPTNHPLHEWWFRSSLDRYVWVFGMVCANMHPFTSSAFDFVDKSPPTTRWVLRSLIVSVLLFVGYWWYTEIFVLPKIEYNQWHPYTSCIPIFIFIILRNLTPTLRNYHLSFFAFLGKITLETYIGQFHIWLITKTEDAQPKWLMSFIPQDPENPEYP